MLKFKEFSALLEDLSGSVDRLNKEIAKLDQNALDDKVKNRIASKLDDTSEYVDKISYITKLHEIFVESKGFSEDDFEYLKNIIQKDSEESLTKLSEYLTNPKDITYFEAFKERVNIPKMLSKEIGVSESTLHSIFGMEGKMKGGKGVGRGELFLGLMIKDAKNSAKGDVNINGTMYEVKAKDARLNTTNGFGQGRTSVISFLRSLDEISPKLKIYTKSKPNDWNFTYSKKKSMLNDLYHDAAKIGKLDEVISATISNIFVTENGIWPNASLNDQVGKLVIAAFNNHVDKRTGSIDMDSLNYALLHANAIYYQSLEKFRAFFLIDPRSGNFAVFNPQIQDEKWLKANVSYSVPSFGDAPTGMCYKIALSK